MTKAARRSPGQARRLASLGQSIPKTGKKGSSLFSQMSIHFCPEEGAAGQGAGLRGILSSGRAPAGAAEAGGGGINGVTAVPG